ncbi:MAG TPA: S41 family peptidase [Holophagaceae bacterium]|nr:S41 family peptidase [Holophagaceae bacterium]
MPLRVRALLPSLLGASLALAQSPVQLGQEAGRAYQAKAWVEAARLYAQAAAQDTTDPSLAYNAACSFALAGDREQAFTWLERAHQAGYLEAEATGRDSDLQGLHGDARWAPFLARMAATRDARAKTLARLWDSPALATPFQEELPEDERIAGLSKFWSEVKYNFVDTERLAELDWDGLYLRTLPRVRAARRTADYYRVLQELCAQLRDGHTNVGLPPVLAEREAARPLIRARWVEDRVFVSEVGEEALRAQGVVPGLEITAVEGRPVRAYLEAEVMPWQSASTTQDLRHRALTFAFLAGPLTGSPAVTFQPIHGAPFTVKLPRVTGAERPKHFAPLPAFTTRWLPGNVMLVGLNSFGDDTPLKAFEQALPELTKARALILDLRENGGGNSSVGYRILAHLTATPFATSHWSTRDYKPTFRAWGRGLQTYDGGSGRVDPAPGAPYTGPVALLMGPGTYSAAEDFAVAFDALKRGPLVGEASGGSTGQPLFFRLPGGGNARVCTKRDTYPDGKAFVGVGVQPTRLARLSLADFRAGRDTVLEVALAELKR